MNIASLHEKKISELQQIARRLGVRDYADLRKRDLIYQILEANAESDIDEDELLATEEAAAGEDAYEREPVERGVRVDRPAAAGATSPPSPSQTPAQLRRAARMSRPRHPIAAHWPAYMQRYEPGSAMLEGMIR
ncbi:MAG TPA: Rho termination factor N-terminal domain-containing protein, partial [Rubricoccaceae bacterium]|nr:Rho termination factor N-terminal domain-containing protein [Rubricoccaceae bacterium]